MRISTKGIYGLSVLIDIARHSDEELVSISSIAARQDLSENYLQQIFTALRKAHLIRSVRGSQGGYELDCDPKTTSLGRILQSLEGELLVVDEAAELRTDNPIRQFMARTIWKKINESIRTITESITFADVLEGYREDSIESMMFYL